MSRFAFTEIDSVINRPHVFTTVFDAPVELDIFRTDKAIHWFIPNRNAQGIIDGQEVLAYNTKSNDNGDRMIQYFPPYGGPAEMIGFDREADTGYFFNTSDLPNKIKSLLFT